MSPLTFSREQSDKTVEELADAIARSALTPKQYQVFAVLTDQPQTPDRIARACEIGTQAPRESASRYCLQLLDRGLAERVGMPMHPKWKRAAHATEILIRRNV